MAKLYFKYGAMGSSKSAQALITQFNYEELGMTVWLIKPSIDDRDGANIVKSRVGLMREAEVVSPTDSIRELYSATGGRDVIIADEAQFFTPEQIDELIRYVDLQMSDTTASWHMQPDGTYIHHSRDDEGRPLVDSQEYLIRKHQRRPRTNN